MMKKLLLLAITIVVICMPLHAQDRNLEELFTQIDEAIGHSSEYVAAYEQQINHARETYGETKDVADKCRKAMALYEWFRAYQNDSALLYLDRAEMLATQMKQRALVDDIRSLKAFQCSTVGLYNEALTILRSVDKQQLDTLGLMHYYRAQMHVFGELGYYTQVNTMREGFYAKQVCYRDSFYQMIDHTSPDYMMRRILELQGQNRLKEAMTISDRWLKDLSPDSRDYAIASYYRYLIVNALGDVEESKYWLSQSALCDVRNAVMDQASLLALADKLNADGDLTRSYKYIQFTWDCNKRFNTRMRAWQISPILDVIDQNYKNQMAHNAKVLTVAMIIVSILALLLLGALFMVHRRNKQLDSARNALKSSNEELATANSQLAEQTKKLSALNAQLSTLNSQLSESNRVKEEYIGRFMSLCSQYIDKLDSQRKLVNKMMKNKQLDELFRLTKSTEYKEKDLEELYENFDSVFLHLFPNFVDDFNALLQPEMQVQPKEGNRLTTEIRIFALIRLGIEDSSKIAEFLHYSVNTIYNYRARIKNGAVDNRESFERRVKQLGQIL